MSLGGRLALYRNTASQRVCLPSDGSSFYCFQEFSIKSTSRNNRLLFSSFQLSQSTCCKAPSASFQEQLLRTPGTAVHTPPLGSPGTSRPNASVTVPSGQQLVSRACRAASLQPPLHHLLFFLFFLSLLIRIWPYHTDRSFQKKENHI